MRLIHALIFTLFATPAMAQLITTPTEVLRASVNNVIRPAMADFAARTDDLVAAMDALCAKPSLEAAEAAGTRFADAALAYARIEAIRIGPLMEENRAERILFWPDRRGIALRQVQAILAEADESATDPATLEGKSVAVQGLGALEFVLYGTGAETLHGADGDFRCRYGQAIALNLASLGDELVTGWADPEGISLHLMRPSVEFVDYRTPTEALEAVAGVLAHGIEAVRDTRVNPMMPRDGKPGNPRLALFWRSGQELAMIRADFEGLRRLFDLSSIGMAPPAEHADIAGAITAEFDKVDAALDRLSGPIADIVADPDQVAALTEVIESTQALQMLIGEQLSSALGLSVGFSSLDGDGGKF